MPGRPSARAPGTSRFSSDSALQLVDQIDHVEEAPAQSGPDAGMGASCPSLPSTVASDYEPRRLTRRIFGEFSTSVGMFHSERIAPAMNCMWIGA